MKIKEIDTGKILDVELYFRPGCFRIKGSTTFLFANDTGLLNSTVDEMKFGDPIKVRVNDIWGLGYFNGFKALVGKDQIDAVVIIDDERYVIPWGDWEFLDF